MEIFIAFILFIPVFDASKRNFAVMMSRRSFLPNLKRVLYIVAAFLVLTLFTSWKASEISANGNANMLRKVEAKYNFILAFSTLVMGPLIWRYFAVMSKVKRLEKSNAALKRQALQASKLKETLMAENKLLTETHKKWRALSFEREPSLVVRDKGAFELEEDEVSMNIRELKRQQRIIEKKNMALMAELAETKKKVQNQKFFSLEQAERTSKTYDEMRKELESYKMMAFKSNMSLGD